MSKKHPTAKDYADALARLRALLPKLPKADQSALELAISALEAEAIDFNARINEEE